MKSTLLNRPMLLSVIVRSQVAEEQLTGSVVLENDSSSLSFIGKSSASNVALPSRVDLQKDARVVFLRISGRELDVIVRLKYFLWHSEDDQ